MTFFDTLANLRMEFDRLCLEGSPRTCKDIVKAFRGVGSIDDKQMRTLVKCATSVMRLPIAVIDAIGDVTNGEHPDICLSSPKLKMSKVSSVYDMMCIAHCRV